jgi:hypothetical protein
MTDLEDSLLAEMTIDQYVMGMAEEWRNHYNQNYKKQHEEYYYLWRGIWRDEDKTRESERSRIIAPALQQAVESNVSEIEEATFGRGKFFDISDDYADKDSQDITILRNLLSERFEKDKIKKAVSECILTSAIYGTGIGEITLEEVKEMKPATRPIMDGAMKSVGVEVVDRVSVKLRNVLPQNFLIDPVATSIEESVGVIIDEYVPTHLVEQMQEAGVYNDVDFQTPSQLSELEKDPTLSVDNEGKTRLTKYYGLVPREMLSDIPDDMEGSLVEAIVIIANEQYVLKADVTPYMMQDRPVVAFQWDIVPNRFWGRGVCEKGYNSQKALDAELRARMDALALTVHPMMAVDATKLARGAKLEIKAGKTILTNGNPAEALMPFKFGNVDQVTFAQGAELQRMVQQATGASDATGVTGGINGEATAAGISMSLGSIIKRQKRTLISFHESFLLPFVEKAAWRYMQFDPDNFPVSDYKFVATSTLGIIAREYEVTQLVQLLNTTPPDSPAYSLLIKSVIENMNISNREEFIAALEQSSQQSPEQQQAAQQAQQMQMQMAQLEMALKQAQVAKEQALAEKAHMEAQLMPKEVEAKYISALSNNLDEDNEAKDFERRMRIAELALKEKDIESNERIAITQMQAKQQAESKMKEAIDGI